MAAFNERDRLSRALQCDHRLDSDHRRLLDPRAQSVPDDREFRDDLRVAVGSARPCARRDLERRGEGASAVAEDPGELLRLIHRRLDVLDRELLGDLLDVIDDVAFGTAMTPTQLPELRAHSSLDYLVCDRIKGRSPLGACAALVSSGFGPADSK